MLQLSAPGVSARIAASDVIEAQTRIRTIPSLLAETFNTTLQFIARSESLTGVVFVIAIGIVAGLLVYQPQGHGAGNDSQFGFRSLLRERPNARGAALLAIVLVVLATLSLALLAAVGHYSVGIVFERSLISAILAQLLSGLVWGAYVGALIKESQLGEGLLSLVTLLALVIVAGILLGNVFRHIALIPDFAAYAQDWDARHRRILQLKDDGQRDIEVAPYSYDMSAFISSIKEPISGAHCYAYFYDVDSITVRET